MPNRSSAPSTTPLPANNPSRPAAASGEADVTGYPERTSARLPSRRKLLFGGSLLAGFWGSAQARAGGPGGGTVEWLIHRLTFGMTPAELSLANSFPAATRYDDYVEHQLDYAAIDDAALNARLATLNTLTMTAYETSLVPDGQVISQLTEATILRSVLSQRQLFERMVEFWTDHFNIDITAIDPPGMKTVDDRDVIRAHALGTFPALLSASAHSPAMLVYLDNATSVVGNPNENYARELLELHSLGVDGGYTQQDVVEVARCFTGWGVYRGTDVTQRFTFLYRPAQHDNGPKTVLGVNIPAGGGINDGLTVLNILATHPSTAQFIARKLCERFWGEDPPPSLVSNVAATYTGTAGDIREMLRTLFHDPAVADAPPKYKRPYHQMMSALRATAATINTVNGIRFNLTAAGQLPFYWGPPDGYPDKLDHWVGLILPRWNFGASLPTGGVGGTSFNTTAFYGGAPNTAQGSVDRIDSTLFAGQMNAAEKARIRDYLLPDPPTTGRKQEAVGLAIGSPGFQWH